MSNYTTRATAILQMNTDQIKAEIPATVERINKLKKALADAAAAGKTALAKQLRKELREAQRDLKLMESAANDVARVMSNLDKATPRQLNAALKQLNRELQDMERGTAAWNLQVEKIRQVKAELVRVNTSLVQQDGLWTRFSKKMFQMGNAIFAATAAATALIQAGRSAVNAYASMEEQMTNTVKYTGMAREEVEKMNEAFVGLNSRLTREKMNEFAQEAGRLGKNTRESVQGYVEAANILSVALVDLGEGATQTIAKLTNIFGVEKTLGTRDAMLSVGSAVNVLSQNCTASKPYLVEFAQRLAGIGAQAGMTIQQILAFAATLDANGQKVEMSASALSRLIMMLFQKPGEIAQKVGLDVQQFTDTLQRSTNEGLMMFLGKLHEMGNDNALAVLSPLFKDLGMDGIRMAQVLSVLAQKIDMVQWEQRQANKAFEEATSATKEYDLFNNTAQAGIEKARNRVHELAVSLGEKLLPVMRHIYTSGGAMLRLLNAMVSFVVAYKGTIIALAAAIAGYNVVIKLATIETKLHATAMMLARVRTAAWMAIVQLGYAAIALFTGRIRRATMEMRIFSAVLHASPLGLLVAGISAACAGLVMLWKRFSDNTRAATEAARKQREYVKSLTDVESASKSYSKSELANLRALYTAATNETLARNQRIEAVKQMQRLYPQVFSDFSNEQIMAGKAKAAYDELTDSIIANARARAAADKIKENEEKIIDLEQKRVKLRDENKEAFDTVQEAVLNRRKVAEKQDASRSVWQEGPNLDQGIENLDRTIREHKKTIEKNRQTIHEGEKEMELLRAANLGLARAYNVVGTKIEEGGVPSEDFSGTAPSSEKGSKGGRSGKSAKEDKFAAEKEWREREEALNTIAYRKGEKNFEAYQNRILEIATEYESMRLKHTDLTENERLTIEAAYLEAQRKQLELWNKFTLEDEESSYKMRIAVLQDLYLQNVIDTEAYNGKLEELELEHLRAIEQITLAQAEARINAWEDTVEQSGKLMEEYKGNVDLLNRKVIDAYELTKKGWPGNPEREGTGETATVYSSQYGIEDASGKVREILVTPILPDGSVLSPKELENYIDDILEGSEDILAADEKKIVIAVDVDPDGSAGERLHELQEQFYSPRPEVDEAYWKDYLKAHENYQKRLLMDQQANQKAYQKQLEEHQKQMSDIWDKYFVSDKEKRQQQYNQALALVEEAYREEIAKEGYTAEEKLEIERRYQEALKKLREEFLKDDSWQNKSMEDYMGDLFKKLFPDADWEKWKPALENMYASVASVYQSLTQMAEAEEQIRLANMKKRYDAEISMAEGNAYKVKELEKKRTREEAKIKAEASKRMFAQQVIAALGQTATAALNAYSSTAAIPIVGPTLAPIAAAIAVAAGMLQVAAIKKQQAASLAQGYAQGGFTPAGRPDEPAGIVHAGEWVASQKLLQNPQARAAVETLDYAQRNNAFGVLRGNDVSRQITAPSVIAQVQPQVIINGNQDLQEAISRLNERLNEPFVTVNTVTGDLGTKRAQDDYQALMNNTLPKSKRK